MGQATREAREAGWIPGAMLAWAAQPLRPSTIHPDNSFAEDGGGSLEVRSQSGRRVRKPQLLTLQQPLPVYGEQGEEGGAWSRERGRPETTVCFREKSQKRLHISQALFLVYGDRRPALTSLGTCVLQIHQPCSIYMYLLYQRRLSHKQGGVLE